MKRIYRVFSLLIIGVFAAVACYAQPNANLKPSDNQGKKAHSADVLVVYYSRTGNTEAMAKEIAHRYAADIISIKTDAYSLDKTGSDKAKEDASNQRLPNLRQKQLI